VLQTEGGQARFVLVWIINKRLYSWSAPGPQLGSESDFEEGRMDLVGFQPFRVMPISRRLFNYASFAQKDGARSWFKALVLAQQDERIDPQRALRRNPSCQHSQQRHGQNYAGQYERIARRCLIHNGSEHSAGKNSQEQSRC